MTDVTDYNIYNITNFLIDFEDLISLSLVSKEYNRVCKIKLDNLKDDYYFIENILIKIKKDFTIRDIDKIYYRNYTARNFFNLNNNFNSWYKYGYYIFPSIRRIIIPKNKKFKIKIHGEKEYCQYIIRKKKKYRF